ncbi:MAG: lactate utilization protein C [Deltaproteobacteria bacterium HGW-Deltaproteobacteria-15]|jgi:L-lactate utilization protein LutB|nr:MAG: lactate utilization protein C [Deltaproteobacteria bacterium HGW-Deltaproteobacteria-15]
MSESCEAWLGEKQGERCVEALKSHGFDAHFVSTSEEARDLVLMLIGGYESFGFGGSNTTRSIGILDELKARGKKILDHWQGEVLGEQTRTIRLEQGRCDCFLSSANAISATGEIVNVDALGNRTNAMSFGPRKTVIVAGINKVRPDLESALRRVREIAAPMRARSLNMKTPCAETGVCTDCNSPQRICRITTILHRKPMMSDISVVLVNESMGF